MSYLNCLTTPPMLYLPSYTRREITLTYDARYLTDADPFIVGERIYLRPLEPAQDNHLYSTWMNDEEIAGIFDFPHKRYAWQRAA